MERGEISNVTAPVSIVVFDGLLGVRLPVPEISPINRLVRKLRKEPPSPEFRWEINRITADGMYQAFWRGAAFEVVTFAGPAGVIEDLLARANVPYRGPVRQTTSEELARELAHRPDVARVYHAIPEHGLRYGARGLYLAPENRDKIGII